MKNIAFSHDLIDVLLSFKIFLGKNYMKFQKWYLQNGKLVLKC